jgi:hypothetical protein
MFGVSREESGSARPHKPARRSDASDANLKVDALLHLKISEDAE